MASSLEIGKLVAASFLYRYWKKCSIGLRTYLFSAVLVLMAITSFGIYGFLSKAFRDNDLKVDTLRSNLAVPQGEIALLQQQADIFGKDIEGQNQKILSHNEKISEFKGRVDSLEARVVEREEKIRTLEGQVESLRSATPDAVPANEKQISAENLELI